MDEFTRDARGNVQFVSAVTTTRTNKKQTNPTMPVSLRDSENKPFSLWGSNNLFPREVLDQTNKVSLIDAILDWKARALYSGGLAYGVLQLDENGEETFVRMFDQQIEDWLECTDAQKYLMEATSYFYYYYNIFPELVQSVDGKTIKWLACLETPDCRWAKRTKAGKTKGLIEQCFVSADWKLYNNEENTDQIDVIQTQRDPFLQVAAKKNKKWVYPVAYPSPGRAYYQRAPWHVLLDTWMPIAEKIPGSKKSILNNQMTVKYIVRVPEWFFEHKYKDWKDKGEKDQLAIMKKEKTDFEEFMAGADNAGKSLMVISRDNKVGIEYKDWQVEAVDDKLKDGKYIEDSQEADAHIFKNLNVDPTLFGAGAGKNSTSSGSGSDKRVAWNNYVIMNKAHQDLIMKPLNFIAKYNGWAARLTKGKPNSKMVFWFKNYMIAKLDSGKETQEE